MGGHRQWSRKVLWGWKDSSAVKRRIWKVLFPAAIWWLTTSITPVPGAPTPSLLVFPSTRHPCWYTYIDVIKVTHRKKKFNLFLKEGVTFHLIKNKALKKKIKFLKSGKR